MYPTNILIIQYSTGYPIDLIAQIPNCQISNINDYFNGYVNP